MDWQSDNNYDNTDSLDHWLSEARWKEPSSDTLQRLQAQWQTMMAKAAPAAQKSRWVYWSSISVAAAVLFIAGVIAWEWMFADYRGIGSNYSMAFAADSHDDSSLKRFLGGITRGTHPIRVGQITNMIDCRWPKNQPELTCLSPITTGQTIKLDSGWIEIVYDRGATIILEGPVVYEVRPNGGCLVSGKLVGKIKQSTSPQPPLAEESKSHRMEKPSTIRVPSFTFAIRTPVAGVVNVSPTAEFGVKAAPKQSALIQVFEGSVALCPINDLLEQAYQVLQQGESSQVNSVNENMVFTTPSVESSSDEFVRGLSKLHGAKSVSGG